MSIHRFIATTPEFSFTGKGHARFFSRVGIEQHRKEVEGRSPSSTRSTATWCCSTRAAERAYLRFKPGDQIVASGYVHE